MSLRITGTLIWYYYVCKREMWLMSRELNPFQEDQFLEIGRLIHDRSYKRERKEIEFESIKFDLIKRGEGDVVVGEVKKSSRFEIPARMQLVYYLYRLKQAGLNVRGELLIPKERKRFELSLTPELENKIKQTINNIKAILSKDSPPEAVKIKWCRNCAYREFCWA